MDLGLCVLRLVFGLLMAAHGSQKLFGWFRGYGLAGTGAFMESLDFHPGRVFATVAGVSEIGGGLLLAIGLAVPAAAATIVAVMITAIGSVHLGNGLLATSNGVELPLLYATVAAVITWVGPGAYSADSLLGLANMWSPTIKLVAIAMGVAGGFFNLVGRRPVTPEHKEFA
jgi:putative oxidoreductase